MRNVIRKPFLLTLDGRIYEVLSATLTRGVGGLRFTTPRISQQKRVNKRCLQEYVTFSSVASNTGLDLPVLLVTHLNELRSQFLHTRGGFVEIPLFFSVGLKRTACQGHSSPTQPNQTHNCAFVSGAAPVIKKREALERSMEKWILEGKICPFSNSDSA